MRELQEEVMTQDGDKVHRRH